MCIPSVAIQNNKTPPVFRPSTTLNQSAQNMTIYTVSLTYTYQNINYTRTKCVYHNPEDKTAPIPAPPLLKHDFSSKYDYVYNYTNFVRLVNVALQSAFTDLCTQVPTGAPSPLFSSVAPYLDFDIQTFRIILHADQNVYNEV